VIVTFFSLNSGKISAIAKSAKKSAKRFSGVLELFSVLSIVYGSARGKGLPVLQEATVVKPFSKIRSDIQKTAYASYWAEMVHEWMADGEKQKDLYRLFVHVMDRLDAGQMPASALSVLFQVRFFGLTGYSPNVSRCAACHTPVEDITDAPVAFDLRRGGILCRRCAPGLAGDIRLHIGTLKQLGWIQRGGLDQAGRIRLDARAIQEGLALLEAFGPYHFGKIPKSLTFLQQIRR